MSGFGSSELTALVGQVRLLRGLDRAAIERLLGSSEHRRIHGGQALYRCGEEADSLAIVVLGRLLVVRDHQVVAEITRGGATGELGVLTAEPRVADVIAVRDTEVLLVPRPAVLRELHRDGPAALVAAAAVAELINRRVETDRRAAIVAVVRAGLRPDTYELARRLAAELGAQILATPTESGDVIRHIARAEEERRPLVLVSDVPEGGSPGDASDGWRELCIRRGERDPMSGPGAMRLGVGWWSRWRRTRLG